MNPEAIQPAAIPLTNRTRKPAVRASSSRPRATDTSCDGRARVIDADRRRKEILSDLVILESIRTVLRLRGVPLQDVEDVLNDVVRVAQSSERMPLDDREQARLWLGGVARHKAVDHARRRKRAQKRHVPGEPEEHLARVAAKALPPDEQVFARWLLEMGRKLFPRTHGWFERAVQGETHRSIAAEARVAEGTVTVEISMIRRRLRDVGSAVIVLVFVLAGTKSLTREPGTVATSPHDWAEGLREQARHECAAEQWKVCLDHLEAAADDDPEGDTPELKDLREKAQTELEKTPDNAPPR